MAWPDGAAGVDAVTIDGGLRARADGFARVAVAVAEIFLRANGLQLEASDDEIVELTLGVASGTTGKPDVTDFYAKRLGKR